MRYVILVAALAAGIGGLICGSHAQSSKKQPNPEAASDRSLQQGSTPLPSRDVTPGQASGPQHPKPNTGAAVPSGGTSTGQPKPAK